MIELFWLLVGGASVLALLYWIIYRIILPIMYDDLDGKGKSGYEVHQDGKTKFVRGLDRQSFYLAINPDAKPSKRVSIK